MYYKLGKLLLKSGSAFLYYNASFEVLQSKAGITKQSGAIITQYNLPGDRQFVPENS